MNLLKLNKQKRAILFLSKHSASSNFLPPSKGYLKTHSEFNFGMNINFIYSNSPRYFIQKVSEADPDPLPTSKMELAVAIINGPPFMSNLPYLPGDSRICNLLPILLLSCKISSISNNSPQPLTLFASKQGKICTLNSIYSFSYLFVFLYLRWFFRLFVNFVKLPLVLILRWILQL